MIICFKNLMIAHDYELETIYYGYIKNFNLKTKLLLFNEAHWESADCITFRAKSQRTAIRLRLDYLEK